MSSPSKKSILERFTSIFSRTKKNNNPNSTQAKKSTSIFSSFIRSSSSSNKKEKKSSPLIKKSPNSKSTSIFPNIFSYLFQTNLKKITDLKELKKILKTKLADRYKNLEKSKKSKKNNNEELKNKLVEVKFKDIANQINDIEKKYINFALEVSTKKSNQGDYYRNTFDSIFYSNLKDNYKQIIIFCSSNNNDTMQFTTTTDLAELFTKDKELYNKIIGKLPPYTEKQFLIGLNRNESITFEKGLSIIKDKNTSKFDTAFKESIKAIHQIGYDISGTTFAAASASPILSLTLDNDAAIFATQFILNKDTRKNRLNNPLLSFNIKYMPNQGFKAFESALFAKYHKLFYYNEFNFETKNENENKNEKIKKTNILTKKINKYIKFIIGSDVVNYEKNFIDKVNNLVCALDGYEKELEDKLENKSKSVENDAELNKLYELATIENNSFFIEEYKKYKNDKLKGGGNFDIKNSFQEGGNKYVRLNNNTSEIILNNNSKFSYISKPVLENNVELNNTAEFSPSKIKQYGYLHKMHFRFNYKFQHDNKEYLLTSGNINYIKLFEELGNIIYSKSIIRDSELIKVKSFFVNDTLYSDLISIYNAMRVYFTKKKKIPKDNSTKYKDTFILGRFLMTKFLKDYLISFLTIYLTARFNINYLIRMQFYNNLIENKTHDDLPFNNLYNQSYGLTNKPVSDSKNIKEIRIDKIQSIRNKIIYYSLLMKYAYIAMEHLMKKFKILIIINPNDEIYKKYNSVENKINRFLFDLDNSGSIFTEIPDYI